MRFRWIIDDLSFMHCHTRSEPIVASHVLINQTFARDSNEDHVFLRVLYPNRWFWITRGFVQIKSTECVCLWCDPILFVYVWRRRLDTDRTSNASIANDENALLRGWSCAWHFENTIRLCCRMHQMIFVFVYACGMCCCGVCVWLIKQIDCVARAQSSPTMTRRLYSGQLFHSKNK